MRVILLDRCRVVHIPFVCMVELKFPAHFPVDHLADPVVSCLILRFCGNLLHSLIIWFIVSSLHSQHLLFCCVLSILALIWLVLMALFSAAIGRDSVSLIKFPFLSHVHVLSYEMLFISRLKTPIKLFSFPFLFPSYYHSVIYRVVSIVFDCRNQSSIVFFGCSLRVVVSMCQRCLRCLQVPLPLSFLGTYSLSTLSLEFNALCMVISFSSALSRVVI